MNYGLSSSDAEDLSQIVLIDLLRCESPVTSPRAWVRKVATRKAWRSKRQDSRNPVVLRAMSEASYEPRPEARIDVARAFGQFREEETRLWLSRKVLQSTIPEMVETEDSSASTLKRRVSWTSRKLRRRLE